MSNSANPNWKPGIAIDSPVTEMITLSTDEMEVRDIYKLLIGSIVPRPIAFVSTISSKGIGNLAPFSFFNAVSSKPPTLMISCGKKPDGTEKDTAKNIVETGEFVVNSASEWIIEPLVYCAGSFPEGVNEMKEVGLTALSSEIVKPARVKESPIQLECTLIKSLDLEEDGVGSTTMFFGKVLKAHIYKEAYQDGRIDFKKIKSVGRLGGFQYGLVSEIFELKPPRI